MRLSRRSRTLDTRLELGGFEFPMGTNGALYTSFSVFNDGKIRPTPRDTAHEISAVGVPMLAMQGASRFWIMDSDDGSKLLTWENFFLNADTNAPVNAQIRLCPGGDFTARSNEVARQYRRINDRRRRPRQRNRPDAAPLRRRLLRHFSRMARTRMRRHRQFQRILFR